MLKLPMDVLEQFPVRKTKVQKEAFCAAVTAYVEGLGYDCREETGSFHCKNLVIGDPENAKFLVTAHYDTCAGMLFPNFLTPCSLPGFLLCQLMQLIFIGLASFTLAIFEGLLIAGFGSLIGIDLGDAWILFVSLVTPTLTGFNMIPVVLWMMFGPANKHNSNDNTSGVVTLLEIARTMPENQRHKVCFVLFDLEEAGLIGSAFYRKAHRQATNRQIVLNLDCVGDGDHLRMFPTKALVKNRERLTSLYKACGYFGKKNLLVQEKGWHIYPSDQMHFPYGVGICALRKWKKILYMSRIHTKKDTFLDETNVNILRAALTTFICRDAVQ